MRLSNSSRTRLLAFGVVALSCSSGMPTDAREGLAVQAESRGCPLDDSGLRLPAGFCATVFADGIGHARHMVAAPNGILYVNTWSGEYYGNDTPPAGGFLVALRDTTGAGKADVTERFGETSQQGAAGGTGIGIHAGSLYAESNDRIVRYALATGSTVPGDAPQTIVSGLPLGGDHPMHPFAIAPDGALYVDVASASNSCQARNRQLQAPGADPCTELETRGGVWRYDANATNQVFSPKERFATGIRNAGSLAIDAAGRVYATQHGRDQLHSNWPALYVPEQEATLPAEELLLLKEGGDYGWPFCYYDPFVEKLVLAPEYGGDGGKTIGRCASKIPPVAAFPAHWAPNGMVHYDKTQFPERYRNGVFIAFHGSWNRAPFEQGGYNVAFQPLDGGRASGRCEVFADGFAGAVKSPEKAAHRPTGLAVGPDGSLFVSDDIRGRIYRVVYQGGAAGDSPSITPCPDAATPAGPVFETAATTPDAPSAEAGPVPNGATPAMVALGDRIYHGQVGRAACTGCHGETGQGTPLGPALTGEEWLWSDGSYAGIEKTITDGVPEPKRYRSPMPAAGGAQLSRDDLSALAAYVWSMSHRASPDSRDSRD
jgi:glucose/arabinose dehydrogenase/mono/diheme cytochrome c family protein